ncbi:DNA-binding protein [Candidatus Bathyarchaeota archaeon]|nr:DNA-binding protein [Candidatus Bathyarchaeota archaeon]
MRISELRVGLRSVNVEGKITDISDVRRVTTRRGEESRVATATLVDDTGSVKLTLWNENIDAVKVGNVVKIENGYVTSFRGEIQLNVGRFGRLAVLR